MPRGSGTGPLGYGPGTGRGHGPCGWGCPHCPRWGFGANAGPRCRRWTPKEEREVLEDEAEALGEELKAVKERLAELKS